MSKVTEALKAARQQAGLSQRQLADALGLSPAFINDLEHGRREFGEQHYQKLPQPIRRAVMKAAEADLFDQLALVRRLMK